MQTNRKRISTETLVLGAILTALVIVLQLMGSFIRFGMFSISLVLLPIVIGASIGGVKMGTWLGIVFGAAVLISGDAAAFLAINVPGTILTVLFKGALCGLAAGLVCKCLSRFNLYVAVVAAAIVCPIVNTGVFLGGCALFFWDTLKEWALADYGTDMIRYVIFGLVGGNFLFEMGTNIILSPAVMRLLNIRKKM